jgi:hypothetical protein
LSEGEILVLGWAEGKELGLSEGETLVLGCVEMVGMVEGEILVLGCLEMVGMFVGGVERGALGILSFDETKSAVVVFGAKEYKTSQFAVPQPPHAPPCIV